MNSDNGAQCIDWGDVGEAALLGAFLSSLGPSGIVFGKAGGEALRRGYTAGFLNKGLLRIDWSFKKSSGRNWFSFHGGVPKSSIHWHRDILPNPQGLGTYEFGIGGGLAGGAISIVGESGNCGS
jgi:hypothetical protein